MWSLGEMSSNRCGQPFCLSSLGVWAPVESPPLTPWWSLIFISVEQKQLKVAPCILIFVNAKQKQLKVTPWCALTFVANWSSSMQDTKVESHSSMRIDLRQRKTQKLRVTPRCALIFVNVKHKSWESLFDAHWSVSAWTGTKRAAHMTRDGQNHIYIRCIYGVFGREFTKYTVIHVVYIRFWPTLHMTPYFMSSWGWSWSCTAAHASCTAAHALYA